MPRVRRRGVRARDAIDPLDLMWLTIGPPLRHLHDRAERRRLRDLWRQHGAALLTDRTYPWALETFGRPQTEATDAA